MDKFLIIFFVIVVIILFIFIFILIRMIIKDKRNHSGPRSVWFLEDALDRIFGSKDIRPKLPRAYRRTAWLNKERFR